MAPGFYDGFGEPQYHYVKPPPQDASSNTPPKPGAGTLQAGPDGAVAEGVVATRDQPLAQAAVYIPAGTLVVSPPGGTVTVDITPYAATTDSPKTTTVVGNAYCITANATFVAGKRANVALMWPADQPMPSHVYSGPQPAGPWSSLGGEPDYSTFVLVAPAASFGCFAVGYPTPKPGAGPTVGGSILPLVTAGAIVLVLLAGIPLGLRRRRVGAGSASDDLHG